MRLLIAAEHFPSAFKGYIDAQAAEFTRLGADVSFLAMEDWDHGISPRLAAVLPDPDIRYVPREVRDPTEWLRAAGPTLGAPLRSAKLARRILSTRGVGVAAARDLLRGLRMGRVDADVCLVHDLTTLIALRALGSLRPDLPVVLWYHGGEIPGTAGLDPADVREALDWIAFALTNTRFSANHLLRRGIESDRVHIHRLGIDPEDYPRVEGRRFRPDGVLRLLFVGRLSDEKGLRELFHAIDDLGPAVPLQLRVAGEGLLDHELAALATRLDLDDRVEFLGRLDLAGVNREMASSDALILASRPVHDLEENQAMVIQEAMFTGLPVLTTRCGGIPEVLPEGLLAHIAAPGDAGALARQIAGFAALGEDEWRDLSDEAHAFAHEHFAQRRVAAPVFRRLRALAPYPDVTPGR
jgi:glycosyltransferase involved in cell wall biosynthesis